ncbi:hypothetical protein PT974_03372 [Cladobotryum mycophilum]|uniref:Uncharacterized protein n=1 Tax=Cladobotryum mycophilum TaxID=491253 RepID=A0ABR0SSR4_9HYPO
MAHTRGEIEVFCLMTPWYIRPALFIFKHALDYCLSGDGSPERTLCIPTYSFGLAKYYPWKEEK